jgi:hypothetical protein
VANTAGLEELVAALAGGGGLEQAAYADGLNRLTDAKSKQALMDKRVAEAYMATGKADAFKILQGNGTDPRVLAELAAQDKAYQESQGVQQQNDARAIAAAIAGAVQDPLDRFNANIGVAGDKMLTPSNVRVDAQAAADLGKTQQEVQKVIAGIGTENARTQAAQALAGERRAKTGAIGPDGMVPLEESPLTKQLADALWDRNAQIPNPDYDPAGEGLFNFADDRQTIPSEVPVNLMPEFQAWRAQKILTDPNMRNAEYALGKFFEERLQQQAAAGTLAPPVAPGAPAAPNRRLSFDPATGAFTEQ